MTFGVKESSKVDAAIVPWVALGFSILVALMAPQYTTWFGDSMPPLSQHYLAFYPLWIVINLAAVIVQKWVKGMREDEGALWKKVDSLLSAVSVLSVIVGVIALVLPEMHAQTFF